MWNDGKEQKEFSSFAAAAKELKIDPKTIPNAVEAGRDSFTRRSDKLTFQIEIPGRVTLGQLIDLSSPKKVKPALPEGYSKEDIKALCESLGYNQGKSCPQKGKTKLSL